MILSQHQKFHKSQIITQQLASLASEVGMTQFEERLSVLTTLKNTWAEGKEAFITVHTGGNIVIQVNKKFPEF